MKNVKLMTGVVLISALALSGCATKRFVQEALAPIAGRTQQNEAQIREQSGQIRQVDARARAAMERAEAAGKLAEGKFLYQMVLSDDSVKFPVAVSELSPEAQSRLGQLVSQLKAENRNVYLEIQGHTDAQGDEKYNEQLGQQRADAVRKYLSQQGVALNRMGTISFGEEQPIADNTSESGRAQNRRVVIMVLI